MKLSMFFFVYVIIISEFCRIGKWGNDGWIGRKIFGIKLGILEFFGGVGGGFVEYIEDLRSLLKKIRSYWDFGYWVLLCRVGGSWLDWVGWVIKKPLG